MSDIMKVDVYELLNISVTADEKEVKRAYRKKALTCHPDKNPDNPKAAELFQQLTKALEILTDSKARAVYDQILRAKKAAAVRNRELDSKRKKLKEDLEAKEKAAENEKYAQYNAAKKLQEEIDRLRKEGSRLVEEEKEFLRQKIFQEREHASHETETENVSPRLKIKWSVQKGDTEDSGNYTEKELREILGRHGHITGLVISSKKKGSAIVEYSNTEAAESAVNFEKGKPDRPLKLSWISGEPDSKSRSSNSASFQMPRPDISGSSTLTPRDYESLVLMRLRQAEERKRLIAQMKEEDS